MFGRVSRCVVFVALFVFALGFGVSPIMAQTPPPPDSVPVPVPPPDSVVVPVPTTPPDDARTADVLVVGGDIRLAGLRKWYYQESYFRIQVTHRGSTTVRHPVRPQDGPYGRYVFSVPFVGIDGAPVVWEGDEIAVSVTWDWPGQSFGSVPVIEYRERVTREDFDLAPGSALVVIEKTFDLGHLAWMRWSEGLNFLAMPISPNISVSRSSIMAATDSTFVVVVEEGRFRVLRSGTGEDVERPIEGPVGMILVAGSSGEIPIFGLPYTLNEKGGLTSTDFGQAEFEIQKGLSLVGLPAFPEFGGPGYRAMRDFVPGNVVTITSRPWENSTESFILPTEAGPYISPDSVSQAYLFVSPEAKRILYGARSWSMANDSYYDGKGAPAKMKGVASGPPLTTPAKVIDLLNKEMQFGPAGKFATTWGAMRRR